MKRTIPELRALVGSNIQSYRLLKGLTQMELAERLRAKGFLRCSRTLLTKIESGTVAIRCFEIFYFRSVFGPKFELEFWRTYYSRKPVQKKARRAKSKL